MSSITKLKLNVKNKSAIENLKTALGGLDDPANNEFLTITEINNFTELEYLYLHPLIERFCKAVPDELSDSEIVLISENDIYKYINEDTINHFFNQALEAHINENIYGGCLIVSDRDNEKETTEDYIIIDCSRAIPNNLYDYDNYTIFNGLSLDLSIKKENFYKIEGRYLPQRLKQTNQGWGRSLIEIILSSIHQYEGNSKACSTLFRRLNTLQLGIKGFGDIIATENISGELLANLEEVFTILEVYNTLITDKDLAEGAYMNRSLGGIGDLIEKAKNDLELIAMSSINMPSILLWGKAGRSGLADKGSSELDVWYKGCNNTLQRKILPILRWMIINHLPYKVREKFNDLKVSSTQLQEYQQIEEAKKEETIEKALTLKQNRLLALFDKGLISKNTLRENLNIKEKTTLDQTDDNTENKIENNEIKNKIVKVLDDDEIYIFDAMEEDDIVKASEWFL